MRVAIFLTEFPTLSETFILNQITGLIDRGVEINIFPLQLGKTKIVQPAVKKYKLLEKTSVINIPQNRWARWLKFVFLLFWALLKKPSILKIFLSKLKIDKRIKLELFFRGLAIRDKEFDLIHCHFGPNGEQAVLLRGLGLIQGKIVVSFHGYDFSAYVRSQGKNVYRQLFREADLLTVNSDFTGKKIRSLGADEKKIVKLPMGVKIDKFNFTLKKLKPKEKIRLLTVARLVEKKGINYSIQAVARVLRKHPHVKYQIVGGGPLREELDQLIRKLKVEKKIKLLGWQNQSQIRRLYQQSHLFILASLTAKSGDQEGQGLVLQEAQACGLPVLSTLHNGIPEGVLNGQSGFLVPEGKVKALAEKLEHLVTHPQIWPKMGQAGRKFVEKRYDASRLSKELVKIYYQLLD